jgi:hypothetical protein
MNGTRLRALLFGCGLAAAALLPAPAQAQAVNLADVIVLIQRGPNVWPTPRILEVVRPQCIAFEMSNASVARLREAGADDALIAGLRSACNTTAPTTRGTTPPRQGVLEITGPLPRGWTRFVNALPPIENRTVTLTPTVPGTIVVTAPGWCPDTMRLTMQAATERHEWTPKLRPRPWVGGC